MCIPREEEYIKKSCFVVMKFGKFLPLYEFSVCRDLSISSMSGAAAVLLHECSVLLCFCA